VSRGIVEIPKFGFSRAVVPTPPGLYVTDPPVMRITFPIPAEHRFPGLVESIEAPATFGSDVAHEAQGEPCVVAPGSQMKHAAMR
jgi:hypothetical protein